MKFLFKPVDSDAQTMVTQDDNDDTRWTKHDGVSSLAFLPNKSEITVQAY